jgi:hypothetical protein
MTFAVLLSHSMRVPEWLIITIITWLYSPVRALASLLWGFLTVTFYMAGLLVQRPTPNLEDQVSVFMTPGDRVAQLFPQVLGTHFSRLLRHEWVTVGLFFNAGHHKGKLDLLIIGFEKFFLNPFQFITKRRHIFSFFATKPNTQFTEQPCSKDGEIILQKCVPDRGRQNVPQDTGVCGDTTRRHAQERHV